MRGASGVAPTPRSVAAVPEGCAGKDAKAAVSDDNAVPFASGAAAEEALALNLCLEAAVARRPP